MMVSDRIMGAKFQILSAYYYQAFISVQDDSATKLVSPNDAAISLVSTTKKSGQFINCPDFFTIQARAQNLTRYIVAETTMTAAKMC